MFPKNWNENKIIEEIKGAWNSSDLKIKETNRSREWSGTSPSVIKIKGYVNEDKVTAYPKYGGEQ